MSTIFIIFVIACWLSIIVFHIYTKSKERKLIKQVTSFNRGESSERIVILNLMKFGINPKAIFHDLYIQKTNGDFTQVDVAVATKAGLIVFEVKDFNGWIFGNEHQRYWTQLLAYGREKHRFYNPVMQNKGHIQAIRQNLPQNPGIPIYSIIVFFGNCVLKDITCETDDTFIIYPHSIRHIVSEILRRPDADFGNKYEIMELFKNSVKNGSNPSIVEAQIKSAEYFSRNKPISSYKTSSFSLSRFRLFPRRIRFW